MSSLIVMSPNPRVGSGKRCEQRAVQVAVCSLRSDACFRHAEHGRVRVSLERWQRAQWAEEDWWSSKENLVATDDHGALHARSHSSMSSIVMAFTCSLWLGIGARRWLHANFFC
jgi:hypothetical protein